MFKKLACKFELIKCNTHCVIGDTLKINILSCG